MTAAQSWNAYVTARIAGEQTWEGYELLNLMYVDEEMKRMEEENGGRVT